jgi:hypothetical protein
MKRPQALEYLEQKSSKPFAMARSPRERAAKLQSSNRPSCRDGSAAYRRAGVSLQTLTLAITRAENEIDKREREALLERLAET